MIKIRKETIDDENNISLVHQKAFGQEAEALLVERLRVSGVQKISLVATFEGKIIGHILLTEAVINCPDQIILGMGLAPLGILPEFQKQGIGSQLVKSSLIESNKQKNEFIIVLGHPEFYTRFGFQKASIYGVKSEYQNISDEFFMIYLLQEKLEKNIRGIAKYHPEFAKL